MSTIHWTNQAKRRKRNDSELEETKEPRTLCRPVCQCIVQGTSIVLPIAAVDGKEQGSAKFYRAQNGARRVVP
jgi:hypothetical protein